MTGSTGGAMCECSHHWYVHCESGQTGPDAICHGITGNATPGPYKPCRCTGFAQWTGARDSRTGEPVKPITLTTAPPMTGSTGSKLFRFSSAARIDACTAAAAYWKVPLDDEIRESAIATLEALEPHVDAILAQLTPDVVLTAIGNGPLLDPDCRDGKHTSCVGPPCECDCHGMCGCHEPARPTIAHQMPAVAAPVRRRP